jgi:K+-sensing histidine kinase KdpD
VALVTIGDHNRETHKFKIILLHSLASGELELLLIRRYVMALFFVAAASVASLLLQRFFAYPFLFLIFAAVMASAWFGGIAPGLVAVLISTLTVDYFFVPPLHSFAINATDSSYFAAFVICAVVASWVSSSKKKVEEALRESRDQLEARVAERTAELEKSLMELRENERQRVLLQSEKSALTDQLETRKLVERAKGILQRELGINEEDTYRTMQRESQQRRKSMKEIAESIILTDDLKRSSPDPGSVK